MTAATEAFPTRVDRERDVRKVLDYLNQQQTIKRDFVVPASVLSFDIGDMIVDAANLVMDEEGVTDVNGRYELSGHALNQLADIFKIPGRYLKRCRSEKVSLFDANLNGWVEEDARSFLLRTFVHNAEDRNYLRAILSNGYGIMDNIDVLMSAIQGLAQVQLPSGGFLGPQNIRDIQVTESRLYIRVEAPEITAVGGEYVKGLRSPFRGTGHGGVSAEHPELVHAGFVITNSEVGDGAFNATGEVIAKVCDNGAQMRDSRIRKVHVGERLDHGHIKWSADTQAAEVKAMQLKVRDAFTSFLTVEWLEEAVAKLNKDAGHPVEDVQKTIEVVSNQLQFNQDEQAAIMRMFFDGGQRTSGGVANAITAAAQTIEDADRANYFTEVAVDAMKIAATV
jgi:hypothetical protein